MQDGLAGLQGAHDGLRGGVDDLHTVVVRHRKIHPHLTPVGPRHDKHRLAGDWNAADFLPGFGIDHQHLVAANGGQVGTAPGDGPAAQVRHFVHRQRLLAAAIAAQNAPHFGLLVPQIDHRQAVFAKQAGNVVAAIGRDQCVVGLAANVFDFGGLGLGRIGEVADPNFTRIKQAVNKAPARQISQPDHARALAGGVFSRHVGQQRQRGGVKHLDAAGRVVLRHHQRAVSADGAANRVAGLHHAGGNLLRQ